MTDNKRLFLKIILYVGCYACSLAGSRVLVRYAAQHFLFSHSYIRAILPTDYAYEEMKAPLVHFNSLGDNKIVNFKPDIRPIIIKEVSDEQEKEFMKQGLLGEAYVHPLFCDIFIQKGLVGYQLHDTIIHEYLHCLGFDHSRIRSDLMYKSDIGRPVSLDNLKFWAYKALEVMSEE